MNKKVRFGANHEYVVVREIVPLTKVVDEKVLTLTEEEKKRGKYHVPIFEWN